MQLNTSPANFNLGDCKSSSKEDLKTQLSNGVDAAVARQPDLSRVADVIKAAAAAAIDAATMPVPADGTSLSPMAGGANKLAITVSGSVSVNTDASGAAKDTTSVQLSINVNQTA